MQGSNTYTYAYNGLGNRVSQTLNAGTPTVYVLDQAAGLVQVLSDGSYTYLYGNDRIAQQSVSETEYFLTDALGSVRQLTNSEGEITLNRSYDPYGNVLASSGDGESVYAFTGEQVDSDSDLIYLRSRYLSPETGRFLSRDSWGGNYHSPQSFNKWLYVSDNPINRIDPLGLWELAPGFNLSAGGIYGKGILEMQGSPIQCEGTCFDPASTSIPIFVPPVVDGKLYNDQHYGRYGYTDIRLIKRLIEYDILQKKGMMSCYLGEMILSRNTDDWKVIYQHSGISTAFSQGLLMDLFTGIAMANGYDQGFVPVNVSFSIPHDQSWSIALAIFGSPKEEEKDYFDLKMWNNVSLKRDEVNAGLGVIIGGLQGWNGARSMNTRDYSITIQEHRRAPGFYRAIIESMIAFKSASTDNGPVFLGVNFISYERGGWVENRYANMQVKN